MRVLRGGVSLSRSRRVSEAACAALLIVLVGCGGGSSSGGSPPGSAPSITSVSISGSGYTQAGLCANFTATVSGTGNYDHSVQWYVNGVAGGSAADGLISTSGSYCAPALPPVGNPVSIKAVANGDTSKFASTGTRVVAITISPTQAQMYTSGTQQFSAVATGGISNSVQWEVNGVVGGNASIGAISTIGLYTAPAQFTTVGISVEAALAEAPIIYAAASLSISAQIVISPQSPQVTYGSTQQFTATINGSPVQVNWAATYGSITSSGLYTATGTQSPDTVRAWTGNANGSTTLKVLGLKPAITGISPQPATALDQITITGANLNPVATVVFSDSIGAQLPVTGASVGTNSSSTALTVTVPQGSVSGPLYVITQQGGLAPVQSNTLQFHRLARLRIRTPQNDLSSGESVTFQHALLGDNTPQNVTFSADVGSFSGATYQASSVLNSDTFAHVTGCISGTHSCDTLILGLHPFRISPGVPLVGIGKSLQLFAILGGGVAAANWSLLAGGGTLTPGGLYNAGTNLLAGGPAPVSATANGATEQVQVGVTGAFPGLLNRINDYFDQNQPNTPGTFADGLTIVGKRMYVAASNHLGAYTDSYFWTDIYDISDPLHPAWLTAVEANSSGPLFSTGQYLYSYQGTDIAVPGFPNTLNVYQLQNQIPVLKAHTGIPQWWSLSDNRGVLTVIPLSENAPAGYVEILIFDITSGSIVSRDFNILLPTDANSFIPDKAIAVGNRLFVSVNNNDLNLPGYILTYDLTTSPPTLLGTVDGRSLAFYTSGNFLFGALGGMDTYDISGQLPQYLSHVDGVNAAQLTGTQLLARTEQQGFRMFDFTNPLTPKQRAILFDGVITGYDISQWVGNYVYEAQGDGGVAIFDATQHGGPVMKDLLYGGPHLSITAFDLLSQAPYLYAATTSSVDGAVLSVYNASTNPITRIGEYVDGTQAGFSVQSVGNYVYFGMGTNTAVLNVSQPATPSLVTTLPVPAASLARVNNTLFAGSFKNSLVTINISNPAQPTIAAAIPLPALPVKLRVSNNLLLVADTTGGLFIFDISSPLSPVLLSHTTVFTAVNDVIVNGSTAFVAADVDGFGVLDISNPGKPVLVSKTSLGRIDPFSNLYAPNEASSVGLSNGIVYVGTINDNGLILGLDCTNRAAPRIVSKYAPGDFIETSVNAFLFNGNELLIAGSLNSSVFPIAQIDMSQPFDSINEYFPPLALQSLGSLVAAPRARTTSIFKPGPSAFHHVATQKGSWPRLRITPAQ